MASLSQLQEDRARADAGQNKENVIAHPKVLRKALLRVFYAESVDEIMSIVCSCDMVEPEPEWDGPNKHGISIKKGACLKPINKELTY